MRAICSIFVVAALLLAPSSFADDHVRGKESENQPRHTKGTPPPEGAVGFIVPEDSVARLIESQLCYDGLCSKVKLERTSVKAHRTVAFSPQRYYTFTAKDKDGKEYTGWIMASVKDRLVPINGINPEAGSLRNSGYVSSWNRNAVSKGAKLFVVKDAEGNEVASKIKE